jgi:hypothetical protein
MHLAALGQNQLEKFGAVVDRWCKHCQRGRGYRVTRRLEGRQISERFWFALAR